MIKQVVRDLGAELPGLKTFVTLSPIPGFVRWLADQDIDDAAQDSTRLRQLAAHYLGKEKGSHGLPLDPVARFHLGNGALVFNVHAGADTSSNGLKQSHGVMVNYLYDSRKIAPNLASYMGAKEVAMSPTVRNLIKTAKAS